MKEILHPAPSNSYDEALQNLRYRSQLHSLRASGALQNTQPGQRALRAFLHICIKQSQELTSADWTALATLALAAAHSAEEAEF